MLKPLAGLRVLYFTAFSSGGFCTVTLADGFSAAEIDALVETAVV